MLLRRIATTIGTACLVVLPATAAQADAPSAQDVAYLQAAYQANMAEVQGSRVAWQKSTDPKVKNLAATFMRDHIRLNAVLYDTARALRVPLPAEPTPEQQALANRYQVAEPGVFDEYFISTQLGMHRAAMRLGATQIAKGSEPTVKKLAEEAAPVIAAHHVLLRQAATAEGMDGYAGTGSGRP